MLNNNFHFTQLKLARNSIGDNGLMELMELLKNN